jgi:hypothetical protein
MGGGDRDHCTMFVHTSNITSDPFESIHQQLLEAIEQLIGQNWPTGDSSDPEVALDMQSGQCFLCVHDIANRFGKLFGYPYFGSPDVMCALYQLREQSWARLNTPREPSEYHRAPSTADPVGFSYGADVGRVRWQDTSREAKSKHEGRRKDVRSKSCPSNNCPLWLT